MFRRRSVLIAMCTGAMLVAVAGGGVGLASTQPSPIAVRCSNTAAAPKVGGATVDLTGAYAWPSSPGFHWYVRQSGTCVYVMYQDPGKDGIAGIFLGGIGANSTVSGIWSDVPYTNDVEGHGRMVWRVSNVGSRLALVVVSQTGGAAVDQILLVKKVTPTG